jgi:hypothetical protein
MSPIPIRITIPISTGPSLIASLPLPYRDDDAPAGFSSPARGIPSASSLQPISARRPPDHQEGGGVARSRTRVACDPLHRGPDIPEASQTPAPRRRRTAVPWHSRSGTPRSLGTTVHLRRRTEVLSHQGPSASPPFRSGVPGASCPSTLPPLCPRSWMVGGALEPRPLGSDVLASRGALAPPPRSSAVPKAGRPIIPRCGGAIAFGHLGCLARRHRRPGELRL